MSIVGGGDLNPGCLYWKYWMVPVDPPGSWQWWALHNLKQLQKYVQNKSLGGLKIISEQLKWSKSAIWPPWWLTVAMMHWLYQKQLKTKKIYFKYIKPFFFFLYHCISPHFLISQKRNIDNISANSSSKSEKLQILRKKLDHFT